jgi:hypothetical protein
VSSSANVHVSFGARLRHRILDRIRRVRQMGRNTTPNQSESVPHLPMQEEPQASRPSSRYDDYVGSQSDNAQPSGARGSSNSFVSFGGGGEASGSGAGTGRNAEASGSGTNRTDGYEIERGDDDDDLNPHRCPVVVNGVHVFTRLDSRRL